MKTGQNSPVDILWYALGGILVVGIIRPLLWWLLLSLSLWIGRNTLNHKWGRRVFGDYWNGKSTLHW